MTTSIAKMPGSTNLVDLLVYATPAYDGHLRYADSKKGSFGGGEALFQALERQRTRLGDTVTREFFDQLSPEHQAKYLVLASEITGRSSFQELPIDTLVKSPNGRSHLLPTRGHPSVGFLLADANRDGFIDRNEFEAMPAQLQSSFRASVEQMTQINHELVSDAVLVAGAAIAALLLL